MRRSLLAPCLLALAATLVLALPGAAAEDPPEGAAGTIGFHEGHYSKGDDAGVATIMVQRMDGANGAVTVDYATVAGTAVEGTDYNDVSGTLSWADGDHSPKTFQVPLLHDASIPPGGVTVQLSLSNPTGGATISSETGTSILVIEPPDTSGGNGGESGAGTVQFEENDYSAMESAGVAVITVEREDGSSGAITVDYATGTGTATPGSDYTPVNGTLSWADGETGTKTFSIPLINDTIEEDSETVPLTLSNPTGGATLGDDSAQLLIRDDDQGQGTVAEQSSSRGDFRFAKENFQVIEGTAYATVVVQRARGNRGAVTVDYATSDGSAIDGTDYTATSGTLSWASGDRAPKTFQVPIIDDPNLDGNETVNLTLSNPTGGAKVDSSDGVATLTIVDNDGQTTPCVADANTLCFFSNRFKVQVNWQTPDGQTGQGTAIPISDQSGFFWFFDSSNIEMLVKMHDACSLKPFNSYWVFVAATTNVAYDLQVTDTSTGVIKDYTNSLGESAEPVHDTSTFNSCP
ncbi:MAG TPA: Calx-beta domain-containing protein [Thermoanaerobaculia bacterium]|nr:Calx-beta domain-containing protein [Thermoanaerobaculia bacterium]